MKKEELNKLQLNTRVRMFYVTPYFEGKYRFGYVKKIYNGNYQLKVIFDDEEKPRIVGYSQINIIV